MFAIKDFQSRAIYPFIREHILETNLMNAMFATKDFRSQVTYCHLYGSREGTSDFRLQTSDFRLQTSDLVRHWFRASLIANIAFAKLANI